MNIHKFSILLGAFLILLIAHGGHAAQFTVKVGSKDLGQVMQQKAPQKYSKIKRINADIRKLSQQMQSVQSGTPLWEAGRGYEGYLKSEKNKAATKEWQGIVGTTVIVIGRSNDDPYYVMRLLISKMVDGQYGHLKKRNAYACFTGANWIFHASIPRQCQTSSFPMTSGSQPGSPVPSSPQPTSPVGGGAGKMPFPMKSGDCSDLKYAMGHYDECK